MKMNTLPEFLETTKAALEKEKSSSNTMWVESVMEKVQEFASAWATVGGRFDDGYALEYAEVVKKELREMLSNKESSKPKQIEFGYMKGKMFFKIGVQMFTLDYDPITTEDFDFMKDNLLQALSNAGVNAVEKVQQFNCFHVPAEDFEKLKALPVGSNLYTEAPSDVVRELMEKAEAVLNRWDSIDWKAPHTGVFIAELRTALKSAKEHGL
jgi:hypothetical protein